MTIIFIELKFSDNIQQTLNITLSKYLLNIKNQIDLCKDQWDIYKKYTNP